MCGIAGFLGLKDGHDDVKRVVRAMTSRIPHRGPDSDGHWEDPQHGLALGHRRLSIVDLSPAGAQPMQSHNGRFVCVYNGEIYNHKELRAQVESADPSVSARWRGHSDTEVMLEAFSLWGVTKTLEKMVGMWAIALWDRDQKTLTLVRDRMGEKPLYYGFAGGTLLFGSELKSFLAFPGFNAPIDLGSVALHLRYSCIGGERTIYQGVHKLAPASFRSFSLVDINNRDIPKAQTYWNLRDAFAAPRFAGSPAEAIDAVESALSRSIADQMEADVPVGAFLSGGIDSTTVVALMQAQSRRPVKTFSIGFHEKGFNEAQHAKIVAAHLKTEHTELYVSANEMQAVVPKLPTMYDEPFADASQIPTFLVSRMTREHVTVSLSGDAGDELFAGYSRHAYAHQLWDKVNRMPTFVRRGFAGFLNAIPDNAWNLALALPRALAPDHRKRWFTATRVSQVSDFLGTANEMELYSRFVSLSKPSKLLTGIDEPNSIQRELGAWPMADTLAERFAAVDALSYLVDDILVKVDRASMANSLESRVPMLDHRFVELAFSLPYTMKQRDGQSKWALRQVLFKHVPRAMVDRPKQGFGVPLGEWLRGPLLDWSESLLSESELKKFAPFDATNVRALWKQHCERSFDHSPALWNILMFQAWAQARYDSKS
jgi:asparagine synthase (glutamine-hydrolysing)